MNFYTDEPVKATELFKDKMTLVNVWASWCTTCKKEHEMIMSIAKNTELQLIGINYKDTRIDGAKIFRSYGQSI